MEEVGLRQRCHRQRRHTYNGLSGFVISFLLANSDGEDEDEDQDDEVYSSTWDDTDAPETAHKSDP